MATLVYNRELTVIRTAVGTQNGTTVTKYPTHDESRDNRSLTVKNPRGQWRPPSYWRRGIWEGYVMAYEVSGEASYRLDNTDFHFQWTGGRSCSGYYHEAVTPYDEGLRRLAEAQCLKKLKRQKVNLAQAFAERKQTARLVQSNAIKIAKAAFAIKRGDVEGVFDALQVRKYRKTQRMRRKFPPPNVRARPEAISDFWLEMQYGWKPLLSDVHGSVEALHEQEVKGQRQVATVSYKCGRESVRVRELPQADSASTNKWYVTKQIKNQQLGKLRLDYVRIDPIPTGLLTELGFTNPKQLAWELVPFSFVVDWFLPLGDYFSLLDAAKGWQLKGGSYSRKTTDIIKALSCRMIPPSGGNYSNWKGYCTPSGSGRQMNFERVVIEESPIPPPPELDTGKSALHVLNGIALLASGFGRKVR